MVWFKPMHNSFISVHSDLSGMCVYVPGPKNACIVYGVPGVCRGNLNLTGLCARCSPQPVHRLSQTENWKGWGPNYTW